MQLNSQTIMACLTLSALLVPSSDCTAQSCKCWSATLSLLTAGADWSCAHMSNITWILFTVWEHKSNNFLRYVKCFLPHFTFNTDFTGFEENFPVNIFTLQFIMQPQEPVRYHWTHIFCQIMDKNIAICCWQWTGGAKKNTDFYLSFNCGLSCITQTILSNPVKWKLHGNKVCFILFLMEKEQRRSEDPCLRYSLSEESDHSELSCLHAQPFAAGRCGCKVHLM